MIGMVTQWARDSGLDHEVAGDVVGQRTAAGGQQATVARLHIRVIRIARPEKKNALTAAMYADMAAALTAAADDTAARVVVITGAPGMFTAAQRAGTGRRSTARPRATLANLIFAVLIAPPRKPPLRLCCTRG